MKNLAIILAAGSGVRFEQDLPKQFYRLGDKTIIEYTIEIFENHEKIDSIFLVIHHEYYQKISEILQKRSYQKIEKILKGGDTRQESSAIGINAIDERFNKVLIHDGARPFTSQKIVSQIISKLDDYPAVNVGINPQDSLITVDSKNMEQKILNRKMIRIIQTPQGFLTPVIKEAHKLAAEHNKNKFTDDCSLVKEFNLGAVAVIAGEQENIKITTPFDLLIAQRILEFRY